jgi:hypothetical protein
MTVAQGTSAPPQLESGLQESQLAGLHGLPAIGAFKVVFTTLGSRSFPEGPAC